MRHAPIRCDDDAPPFCPEEFPKLYARPWRPGPRPAPKPAPSKKSLEQLIAEARAACARARVRNPRVLVRDYGGPPAADAPRLDAASAARRA